MKTIRVKLTNEKGETVTREDGSIMTFLLVDEAKLREMIAEQENIILKRVEKLEQGIIFLKMRSES